MGVRKYTANVLSRMGRNHIHFLTGDIDELKKSKEVFIY